MICVCALNRLVTLSIPIKCVQAASMPHNFLFLSLHFIIAKCECCLVYYFKLVLIMASKATSIPCFQRKCYEDDRCLGVRGTKVAFFLLDSTRAML